MGVRERERKPDARLGQGEVDLFFYKNKTYIYMYMCVIDSEKLPRTSESKEESSRDRS